VTVRKSVSDPNGTTLRRGGTFHFPVTHIADNFSGRLVGCVRLCPQVSGGQAAYFHKEIGVWHQSNMP
jgi:hypothetical protein